MAVKQHTSTVTRGSSFGASRHISDRYTMPDVDPAYNCRTGAISAIQHSRADQSDSTSISNTANLCWIFENLCGRKQHLLMTVSSVPMPKSHVDTVYVLKWWITQVFPHNPVYLLKCKKKEMLTGLWLFTGAWNSGCLWKAESRMVHYLVTPSFNWEVCLRLTTFFFFLPSFTHLRLARGYA